MNKTESQRCSGSAQVSNRVAWLQSLHFGIYHQQNLHAPGSGPPPIFQGYMMKDAGNVF